jgi:hypothetical protein
MLFLIMIFATIIGLVAHYFHLLQECMAAEELAIQRLGERFGGG